ncbi:hypothetical protein F511_04095 [Dorcoceras hygrometricum]|uniref:Uncharacterized protein n=1 Tax=Dorcoceras hygrometricum TaxID=472368 RepID=A0A2Z7CHI8_9LAMI|nr:hypothetical protein F511_04095 [Dorcoceras hygrometricum]
MDYVGVYLYFLHESGSWDQHFIRGNHFFDTNYADPEIQVASRNQGDANTHVGNSDTKPEIPLDESDEGHGNDEEEINTTEKDNMHEETSSRHAR